MLKSQSLGAIRFFGKRNRGVKIRRILAGILVALVLCVSSVAAACDLSCGFAAFQPDCHSSMAAADSASADMTMAGMTMTQAAVGGPVNAPAALSAPQSMPAHAALVEMGACARQSCDQAPVLAARSNHSTATQFEKTMPLAADCLAGPRSISFHVARDDVSAPDRALRPLLDVSLRI